MSIKPLMIAIITPNMEYGVICLRPDLKAFYSMLMTWCLFLTFTWPFQSFRESEIT